MESHLNEMCSKEMVNVCWPHHNKYFIDGLWSMFSEKYKVDVELVIDDHIRKIHQIVLALFSPSFKTYFHILGESVIQLDNVTNRAENIDLLVEFLYRGKVNVEEHKLNDLLTAAENLGIQSLVDAVNNAKSKLEQSKVAVLDNEHNLVAFVKPETEVNVTSKRKKNEMLKPPMELFTANCLLPKRNKKEKQIPIKRAMATRVHLDCDIQPIKICPHCPYRHRCEVLYNKHLNRHKEMTDSLYVCSICDKEFRSRVGLRQHSLYHGDPKLLFSCPHCPFKTSQKPHWVRHLAVNHKIDPEGKTLTEDVKCDLCSFVTTGQNLLKSHHAQKHSTDKPYKCHECDYSSLRKWDVVKHVRIVHRNERPFMCELCGYTSKTSSNLKNHVNRHLGLKPYKCKVCGQDFATVSSLKMHSRIHAAGEKPFVCQLCGHGFLRRYRLTTHMKQAHQIEVVNDNRHRRKHFTNQVPVGNNPIETNSVGEAIQCLLPSDEDMAQEASCIVMRLV